MKKYATLLSQLTVCLFCSYFIVSCSETETIKGLTLYPSNKQQNVNPDTHLKITFSSKPTIGNKGKIRVYDSVTDSLIDFLDLSIPAGPIKSQRNPEASYTAEPYEYSSGHFTNANTKPGTPSGTALPTSDTFQLNIIGGFTDAFHFYPIIVRENTATIYLHNNLLQYNKDYYVLIDSTVLTTVENRFKGIYNKKTWQFNTRTTAPDLKLNKLIVDDMGSGDFNTVQGAIDYIPDNYNDTVTVFIKNGLYEELIYFRNKSNIVIQGEDREKVIVQYANNEVFNPHPWNLKTNEWPGTFPSRRAAFAIDNCTKIQLLNLTVKTLLQGQAEGLLINGDKIFLKGVNIVGSGDALQTNGPAYFEDIKIDGGGDMILGRGPAYFKNCEFFSPGPFMWIRNTDANHGNVFVNCSFQKSRKGLTVFARTSDNNGKGYPYCEAVLLNCTLDGIDPAGWAVQGTNTHSIHYWEYNSTNLSDGKPVDINQRHPISKQLTMPKDSVIIGKYSDPSFVLNGWTPKAIL
ncbi:pectinesterase family protein [uncultured Draconibacterium sp.]|uniref:pectinesterase family protein n=1 Tax=uncultured Draconibacterium sp. TaxID=1573823 RepID=UPI0032172237